MCPLVRGRPADQPRRRRTTIATCRDIAQLDHWIDNAATATTLAEVLGDSAKG